MIDQRQKKITLGIVTTILFVFFIVLLQANFNSGRGTLLNEIKKLYSRAGDSLSRELGFKNSSAKTIKTSEVIEEESTTIDVVENVSSSVVSIIVRTFAFDPFSGPIESEDGIGTGFIVDSNGLIVTNGHVVSERGAEYSVILQDGTSYPVSKISIDEVNDLAVLEIEASNLPVVSLGDSSNIKVGQKAIAIGNALGRFSNTVTVGVISGIARQLTATSAFGGEKTFEEVIQTDAALNPGNSGGPLLNLAGQVIGINVATTRGADNIGFAIPVNTLKPILEGYLKEGRIIRPYLGISYNVISKDISRLRNLPQGIYVTRVFPNSPASLAGITRGDIIVTFDGKKITENVSLASLVSKRKVGDIVSIGLIRDNQERTVEAVLEEVPEDFR